MGGDRKLSKSLWVHSNWEVLILVPCGTLSCVNGRTGWLVGVVDLGRQCVLQ